MTLKASISDWSEVMDGGGHGGSEVGDKTNFLATQTFGLT